MVLVGDFDDERTMNSRRPADVRPWTSGAEPVHALLLLNEQGPATRISLPEGHLLVGRFAPAALILSGATVSRRHCQFERRGNDVLLRDLGSTNGTFVDDARVDDAVALCDGARIAIGGHSLRYYRSAMQPGPQVLTIEIDERQKAAEVAEITSSDYFRGIVERTRMQALRRISKTGK